MVSLLGSATDVITGFVMLKFTASNGNAYLLALKDAARASGVRLLGMPVLESPDIIYRETRKDALVGDAAVMTRHRDSILAVRIGATDLCSAYGLRRPRDLTIYDLHLVAEVIGDIVNIFGRADGSEYTVFGPVWEYFSSTERMWKPQLRTTPFEERHARGLRQELIADNLDVLIREVMLDQTNGLTRKTMIHPTHVAAVNALSVVTHEQFSDATDILGGDAAGGGVRRSNYANEMNEIKPHRAWALKTVRRADVFGVAAPGVTFVDLLEASIHAAEQCGGAATVPGRPGGREQQVPA
jgi:citrate lyase beta subunit